MVIYFLVFLSPEFIRSYSVTEERRVEEKRLDEIREEKSRQEEADDDDVIHESNIKNNQVVEE